VHGQVAALDALELPLQPLLGGIDHDAGLLPEHQALDLDEAEEAALGHTLGVNLVDLPLVEEGDPVKPLVRHPPRS
jgi:hypothetical protein